jgi:cysteine desulfurase family protein
LDHAATSWPKPETVYEAVDHYQREVGAPHGRSGYREALQSNRVIERARQGVAELIGADQAEQVIFTASGTDSLNLAIRGIVRHGDHVVTSVCEHNSVLRPLRALRETSDVSVSYVPCDGQGRLFPDDVRQVLRPHTRLVVIQHGSNVTGAIQPIESIAEVLSGHDAFLLVDAAQTAGHVPIDVQQMGVDLLATPGHKGLLGPLGTGILYLCPKVQRELRPLRMGGTGTHSNDDRQPDQLPDKFESGSHNLPGLAGLAAACDFLRDRGIATIHAQLTRQTSQLLNRLEDLSASSTAGLKVHGPRLDRPWASHKSPSEGAAPSARTSVVSLTLMGYDPQEIAILLEASHGIQSRAGLHCAPKMHQALGTLAGGGTLRLSLGWSTTQDEIDQTVTALKALVATP